MLVAIPLVASKQAAEGSIKLVWVDLLVRFNALLQYCVDVLWDLGDLAHVKSGNFEFTSSIGERQITETAADFVLLKRSKEQPSLTLLSGTTSTTKTMDVRVTLTGKTNLDDVRDLWEIHTTGSHIGREEYTRLGRTEIICSPSTLSLAELGVDFIVAESSER